MTETMKKELSPVRAILTDPQLWLPVAMLALGVGVLALMK